MESRMSEFSELLRSDSLKGNLLSLQAAETIERLEASLERVKRDCAFWRAVAQEKSDAGSRSHADHG